jgi:alkylated DNA nucleotide flippase Atl1
VTSPGADGFRERVVAAVAAIPAGTVSTYGEVAVEAGFAVGASRAVGNVLQQVEGLPWWRVVTASGRLVPGLEERHARLLAAEGVAVEDGRVRLAARRPAARRTTSARARPGGVRDEHG